VREEKGGRKCPSHDCMEGNNSSSRNAKGGRKKKRPTIRREGEKGGRHIVVCGGVNWVPKPGPKNLIPGQRLEGEGV